MNALDIVYAQNIIHRDLKPHNILFTHNLKSGTPGPNDLTLKVADFGVSRYLRQGENADTIIGTRAYGAPEINLYNLPGIIPRYDRKVDMWSLGVIIYELFTGHLPYSTKQAINKTFIPK